MKFVDFKKIPRLSRNMIITEKIDGSNGQIAIIPSDSEEFIGCEDGFIEQCCLATKQIDETKWLYMFAGSRNRWLSTGKQNDNMGFATWVKENSEELFQLGPGRHFGEWYGKGIQRGYGLEEKRWALFNVSKWQNKNLPLVDEKQKYPPSCCEVVPILYEGMFDTNFIDVTLEILKGNGSKAVPGYMNPEGVCIYHTAAGQYFKKTIEGDDKPKGKIGE
jgi:hypothetical protein